MEIIPAADGSNDSGAPAETPVALDVGLALHEPLGVECLEDRVLLAADTAAPTPPLEIPPAEPAALVGAPLTEGTAIHELALTADVADARAEVGGFEGTAGASAGSHAEVIELPHEVLEKPGPESGEGSERTPEDLGESKSAQNEFGLATIEPEANKALRTHESTRRVPSGEASAFLTDEGDHTGPVGEDSPLWPSTDAVETNEQPALDTRVLTELGRERPGAELGASLAEETAIAPLLDELPAANQPTVEANQAEDQDSAAIDTADPGNQADEAHPADAAGPTTGEPVDSESPGGVVHPVADGASADPLGEPTAHDAIFAGGGGVEAVIEHGTSDQKTS
ncbi:MAG TPA: hypothetical protein VG826_30280 [Pirellulales bacterium]|nr:hypothetical protein [Pirellulales bacterium]